MIDTDRSEWLEHRKRSIGGSEWAMALGNSKWGDPLRLYLIKRGLLEIEESGRMEMGQYLEPVLLQWYLDAVRDMDGLCLSDRGRQVFLCDSKLDFLTGNVDMIVEAASGEERIVDAKNTGFRAVLEWGEEGTDAIPYDALFQAHAYLFLRPSAVQVDFVVLRGMHWPPAIYTVPRDEAHEAIVEAALPVLTDLWTNHIVPGVPPSPDFSSAFALEGVKALYPASAAARPDPVPLETMVTIGENLVSTAELMEAHALLTKLEKEAKRRAKLVEAALRALLGEALSGEVAGIKVDRIYNRGGHRSFDVAPFDYLKLKFPKNYEPKITAARIAALLPEAKEEVTKE